MRRYLVYILRCFAAWLLSKCGPIVLGVTPTCGSCGRSFTAVFFDIAPHIFAAAKAGRALYTKPCGPSPGREDALRN